MYLGKAVRVAIAIKGMSQNQVTEKAGLSVGHLNNIIKGRNKGGVTIGVLARIANALDMKLSEMIALGESE